MIRRLVGRLHLWIGLMLCLPLVMLGLTGSILVYEDELRGFFAAPRPLAAAGKPRSIDEIVAAARQAAPAGYAAAQLYRARQFGWSRRGAAGAVRARRNPAPSGCASMSTRYRSRPFRTPETGFFRQLFFLHSTLLLRNREGRQLVGWLGVAMLVIGVSGLVNWWPRRRRLAGRVCGRAGRARLPAAPRAARRRRHLGGRGLADRQFRRGLSRLPGERPGSGRPGAAGARPARRRQRGAGRAGSGSGAARHRRRRALAREGLPDATLRSVFLPAKPDQPLPHQPGARRRRAGIAGDYGLFVDPWTRRVVEMSRSARGSLPAKRFWRGSTRCMPDRDLGPVWKLLVFLSGLLPLLFSVTGLVMWQMKRRSAGARPPHGFPCSIGCTRRGGPANERMALSTLSVGRRRRDGGLRRRLARRKPPVPSATAIARAALPRDLSAWSMFWSADSVVKDGDGRAGDRLGRHLDGRSRQDRRAGAAETPAAARPGGAGGYGVVGRGAGGFGRAAGRRLLWPGGAGRGGLRPTVRPRARRSGRQSRLERIEAARRPGNDARHRHTRDNRRDRALRRPVRDGLGHHGRALSASRRRRPPISRSSPPALRRRCSPPRSGSSPPSRPSCSTTCWRDTRPAAGR